MYFKNLEKYLEVDNGSWYSSLENKLLKFFAMDHDAYDELYNVSEFQILHAKRELE